MRFVFLLCFSLVFTPTLAADEGIWREEMGAILKTRESLAEIVGYMATRPDLFPPRSTTQRVLTSAQKQEITSALGGQWKVTWKVSAPVGSG